MKIVIINGSARKGNTLTAINAFIKGASEKNEIEIIEPDKLNIAPVSYTHLDVYKRQDKSRPVESKISAGFIYEIKSEHVRKSPANI